MDNRQTYRNKLARLHVLAGALEFTSPVATPATLNAAAERIEAHQVEPGEVLLGSNGKPIPEGHYAIYKDEAHIESIVGADRAFFESLWELDLPR